MTRLKSGARHSTPTPTSADLVLLKAKLAVRIRARDLISFQISKLRNRIDEAAFALEAANDRGPR